MPESPSGSHANVWDARTFLNHAREEGVIGIRFADWQGRVMLRCYKPHGERFYIWTQEDGRELTPPTKGKRLKDEAAAAKDVIAHWRDARR